jgi:cytoskeletal protein RodZ
MVAASLKVYAIFLKMDSISCSEIFSLMDQDLGATIQKSKIKMFIAIKPLRYKPEDHGFDSQWCYWIVFIGIILPAALWLWGRLSL